MKLQADLQSFLRNGANKEILFNLIEVALKSEEKVEKLQNTRFQLQYRLFRK